MLGGLTRRNKQAQMSTVPMGPAANLCWKKSFSGRSVCLTTQLVTCNYCTSYGVKIANLLQPRAITTLKSDTAAVYFRYRILLIFRVASRLFLAAPLLLGFRGWGSIPRVITEIEMNPRFLTPCQSWSSCSNHHLLVHRPEKYSAGVRCCVDRDPAKESPYF
jgi:hypothetical protein